MYRLHMSWFQCINSSNNNISQVICTSFSLRLYIKISVKYCRFISRSLQAKSVRIRTCSQGIFLHGIELIQWRELQRLASRGCTIVCAWVLISTWIPYYDFKEILYLVFNFIGFSHWFWMKATIVLSIFCQFFVNFCF